MKAWHLYKPLFGNQALFLEKPIGILDDGYILDEVEVVKKGYLHQLQGQLKEARLSGAIDMLCFISELGDGFMVLEEEAILEAYKKSNKDT